MNPLLRIAYKIYRPIGILKERRKKRLLDRVLNDGERFDPKLDPAADRNHVPRYAFACGLIGPEETVIDIACGTGYGTEMLSRRCRYATGVDISEEAIRYCRKKRRGGNLTFVLSDFFSFRGRADAVVSFETIEHIRCETIEQVFEKLDNLAGSKIIGSYPFREAEGFNRHHHFRGLDEQALTYFGDHRRQVYYQAPDGRILDAFPEDGRVQNLVFVITKTGG